MKTHGLSNTPEYQVWNRMWSRCTNPIVDRYPRYGGRGIKVCERWELFVNFYEDMGPRPSPKHSLDRINNDGNYEPGNCRWASPREQANNTSHNVMLEHDGEKKSWADWARERQISYARIVTRARRGFSSEIVLKEESLQLRPIEVNGVTKLTTEWMKDADIPISSFYFHRRKGLSDADIVRKYLAKPKRKRLNGI